MRYVAALLHDLVGEHFEVLLAEPPLLDVVEDFVDLVRQGIQIAAFVLLDFQSGMSAVNPFFGIMNLRAGRGIRRHWIALGLSLLALLPDVCLLEVVVDSRGVRREQIHCDQAVAAVALLVAAGRVAGVLGTLGALLLLLRIGRLHFVETTHSILLKNYLRRRALNCILLLGI